MYEVYLGNTLCPIAPSKLQLKIKNQNKTVNLMNDGEINILKQPGLTEVSFDLLLPNVKYPFALYKSGFVNAKYFLDILQDYKVNKGTFQFKVIRTFPNGKILFDNDMKVSLEDYTIKEDAKQGFDVVVSVKLKQYKDYGTKKVTIIDENTASVEKTRPTENSPAPKKELTYTVKSGDTLWNIAKQVYGDGAKYTVIYEANKDKISNPNSIFAGQVIVIPDATAAQIAAIKTATPSSTKSNTSNDYNTVTVSLIRDKGTTAVNPVDVVDRIFIVHTKPNETTSYGAKFSPSQAFTTERGMTISSLLTYSVKIKKNTQAVVSASFKKSGYTLVKTQNSVGEWTVSNGTFTCSGKDKTNSIELVVRRAWG